MGSKPLICKCGHEKSLHKNKKSKLSFAGHCKNCPCSVYLNRKRPDKIDKLSVILCAGLGIAFVVLTYAMLINSNPKMTGLENELITFTYLELYNMMALVFFGIDIFIIFWLVLDPIVELYRNKKRPDFPIDNNE